MLESRLFDGILRDIRYTLRAIHRQPGFYAAVIGTLALGIAANTAIFSIYSALLLEPLPYRDPDRLVMVLEKDLEDGDTGTVTPADFVDWRQRSRSFVHLSALSPHPHFNLTMGGEAERLSEPPYRRISSSCSARASPSAAPFAQRRIARVTIWSPC